MNRGERALLRKVNIILRKGGSKGRDEGSERKYQKVYLETRDCSFAWNRSLPYRIAAELITSQIGFRSELSERFRSWNPTLRQIRSEMRPIVSDVALGWDCENGIVRAYAMFELEVLESPTFHGVSCLISNAVEYCIRESLQNLCTGEGDEVRVQLCVEADRGYIISIEVLLVDSRNHCISEIDTREWGLGSDENWLIDHVIKGIDTREMAIQSLSDLDLKPWLNMTLARAL